MAKERETGAIEREKSSNSSFVIPLEFQLAACQRFSRNRDIAEVVTTLQQLIDLRDWVQQVDTKSSSFSEELASRLIRLLWPNDPQSAVQSS